MCSETTDLKCLMVLPSLSHSLAFCCGGPGSILHYVRQCGILVDRVAVGLIFSECKNSPIIAIPVMLIHI